MRRVEDKRGKETRLDQRNKRKREVAEGVVRSHA